MPYMPVWLVEGMAMYVAGDLPVDAMRAAYSADEEQAWDLVEFTRDRDFGLGEQSGEQTTRDYAYAAFLTRYLVATYGFDRFVTFYDSFEAVPIAAIRDDLAGAEAPAVEDTMGLLAERLTAAGLESTYGTDPETLERDFKRWLEAELARAE